MKKFGKALDKITSLPVLKRRWLYILGTVVFTILFAATVLLSFRNPSVMNRVDFPQTESALGERGSFEASGFGEGATPGEEGDGTQPAVGNDAAREIPDDILEFFENGDFEIPKDGEFEFPADGNFEFPADGDFEFPTDGEFEFPADGEFEFPADGDVEFPTDRGSGNRPGGVRTVRILMVVFGVLDALCIYLLIYVSRKKKRLEREAVQARWDETEENTEDVEAEPHPVPTEEKKRKHPYRIGIILVILVVVVILVVELLAHRDRSEQSQTEATLYSGVAERADITTVLSGAGTLNEDDAEDGTIPEGVEIQKWYVADGDSVETGDLLAKVDTVSVMSAIVEVQEKLDSLDETLAEYESPTESDTIAAPASGRVIKIYAEEDTSVADIMYEDGALMLLSLDGLMAVSFDTDASVTAGDEVMVTLSDGSEIDGRVDSVTYRTVVITIPDDGPTLGETVSVESLDGEKIGEGELSIHSEWKVTGFDGTVDDISVTEGSLVSEGDTLLTLTDRETDGVYGLLLEQRTELVNQMETLFRIYMDGYLYASCDGVISGIDTSTATTENNSEARDDETAVDTMTYRSAGTISAVTLTTSGANNTSGVDNGNTLTLGGSTARMVRLSEVNGDSDGESEEDREALIGQLRQQLEDLQAEVDGLTEQLEGTRKDSGISYSMGTVGEISGNLVTITGMQGGAGTVTVELPERIRLYKDGTYSEASAEEITEGDVLVVIYDGEGIHSVICISMRGSDNPDAQRFESGEDAGQESEENGESISDGKEQPDAENDSVSDLDREIGDLGALYHENGDLGNLDEADALSGALADDVVGVLSDALADAEEEEVIAETYGLEEQTIFSITPQDTMTFEITVDETDILKLADGQEADVVLDAFPGQSFAGTVTEVSLTGTNSGGNTKYTAEITIDREDGMLAGMNASAKIAIGKAEGVLCIPEAALVEENGTVYVYTDYDESTDELGEPVEVTTGVSDGTLVEILSGLEEDTEYFYKYFDIVNYESASSASGNGFF